jgi:hypothetical protein
MALGFHEIRWNPNNFEILRRKFRDFSILDRKELWSIPYLNGNFLFLNNLFMFYISGTVYAD